MTSSDLLTDALLHRLPEGWSASEPDAGDAPEITALLRRHEERGRGWASAGEDDVLIEVSARGYITRENVILRDAEGELRGWASAHDRAAGRMLLVVVVDPRLDETDPETADRVAEVLFAWGDEAAGKAMVTSREELEAMGPEGRRRLMETIHAQAARNEVAEVFAQARDRCPEGGLDLAMMNVADSSEIFRRK